MDWIDYVTKKKPLRKDEFPRFEGSSAKQGLGRPVTKKQRAKRFIVSPVARGFDWDG
jgi:hypothetical protein